MEWLLALVPYVAGATGLAVGLAPHFFSTWKSLPKIHGAITSVISGHQDTPSSGTVTGVIIQVFISNERDRPVSILDYDFQTSGHLIMDFGTERITVPMDVEGLRSQSTELVSSTRPLCGFLVFMGPGWLRTGDIERWRLFVYDGYGRRHVITTKAKDLRPRRVVRDESLRGGCVAVVPHRGAARGDRPD